MLRSVILDLTFQSSTRAGIWMGNWLHSIMPKSSFFGRVVVSVTFGVWLIRYVTAELKSLNSIEMVFGCRSRYLSFQ